MKNESLPHQKKVRLMGNVLAIISWLGLVILAVVLAFFVYLAANGKDSVAFLAQFSSLGEEGQEVVADEFLPDGVTLDMTVRELIAADREFLADHIGLFSVHGILGVMFYAVVAVLFLRIAFSWRRAEPFSRATILGLRWLGIIFLVQFLAGLFYYVFVPESLTSVLPLSLMFDETLESLIGNYGPGLESGILLLTLSWVLEHGSEIKEEQELTV